MSPLNFAKFLFSFLFLMHFAGHAGVSRFYTVDRYGLPVADEPEFIKEITDITSQIDALRISSVNVSVIIKPESDNASFDSGSVIEIPRTMVLYNHMQTQPSYKTTEDALAVYAHEYGHAVFDAHIVSIVPEYAKLKQQKQDISNLSVSVFQKNMTEEQIKVLKNQVSTLEKQLLADKELVRASRLTLPYHEVFADTIAVFVFNNKSAIYEALYYEEPYEPGIGGGFHLPGFGGGVANPHDPNRHIVGRDFSRIHNVNEWKNNSEHGLFSPLRSVIGSDECWPRNTAEQQVRLKHLLQLLLKKIKKHNEDKTFPEINENIELINEYRKACRSL